MIHSIVELEERLPLEQRNLGKDIDYDVVYKKRAIKEILLSDPAIIQAINNPDLDEECPDDYFEENILDYLKVTPTQDDVKNFICYDINDKYASDNNPMIKNQYVTFIVLVNEKDITTNYDMNRVDLLSYLILDNFNLSNSLGFQTVLFTDEPSIIDSRYYARTLTFKIKAPNDYKNGGAGKYDRFARGR